MDKELALIFEYKNAPEELKALAQTHKTNSAAFQKAEAQITKWRSERDAAKVAYEESRAKFINALGAWDPYKVKDVKPESKT